MLLAIARPIFDERMMLRGRLMALNSFIARMLSRHALPAYIIINTYSFRRVSDMLRGDKPMPAKN